MRFESPRFQPPYADRGEDDPPRAALDHCAGRADRLCWALVCDAPPPVLSRRLTLPPALGASTAIQYRWPLVTRIDGTST